MRDFKAVSLDLVSHVTGYKVNCTANEMVVQIFSESQRIKPSVMPVPANLRNLARAWSVMATSLLLKETEEASGNLWTMSPHRPTAAMLNCHRSWPSQAHPNLHAHARYIPSSGNNSSLQFSSFSSFSSSSSEASLYPHPLQSRSGCFLLLTPWYPVHISLMALEHLCVYLTVCMPALSWITSFLKAESRSCWYWYPC